METYELKFDSLGERLSATVEEVSMSKVVCDLNYTLVNVLYAEMCAESNLNDDDLIFGWQCR